MSKTKTLNFLDLPKDIAYLLVKTLSLTDIENLYKAGGKAKVFVKKNFLSGKYLIRHKVKKENLRKYNGLLDKCETYCNVNYEPHGVYFYINIRSDKNIEIYFHKSFFEDYFCFRSAFFRIYLPNLISDNITQIGICIKNVNEIIRTSQTFRWDFSDVEKIKVHNSINRLAIPDNGLINLCLKKEEMEFVFKVIDNQGTSNFSVLNNVLKIGNSKNISMSCAREGEKICDFNVAFKVDKISLLIYTCNSINLCLSNSFLLLRDTTPDYQLKIYFTPVK
jgi:hypothetical protein